MRRRALALGLAAAVLLAGTAGAADAQVRDLSTRRHSTLRTLVVAPEHPRVAAVLLVGGPGVANIPARVTPDWERAGSFLVRNRGRLSARGVYTVLIDAPSDHRFGLGTWRFSPEHAADIGDVVADIRRRAPGLKVWLIATSAGTVSAANAAILLSGANAPDGLVLTSPVARTLPSMSVENIRVPVLLVQHRDDQCTPLWAAESLPALFTHAPRIEMLLFSGGGGPRPDACAISAPHSFYGIDDEVVQAIAAWIGGG